MNGRSQCNTSIYSWTVPNIIQKMSMEAQKVLVCSVSQKRAGMKLREVLFQEFHTSYCMSSKYVRKRIEQGSVSINGQIECFGSRIVQKGDTIRLYMQTEQPSTSPSILYEDEYFLALSKPPFIVSSLQQLIRICPHLSSHFHLVHRLDKETSGVLLIAKTKEVFELFLELFRKQAIKKTYIALVRGCPKDERGVIIKPLALKQRVGDQAVWHIQKNGLYAETEYKVLQTNKTHSLLEVVPKTGRTHQIRIHLASIGCPLVGDKVYGGPGGACRHLLHAYRLCFSHPVTQRECVITATLPEEFTLFSLDVKELL